MLRNGLRVVVFEEPGAPVTEIRLAMPFACIRPELAAPIELLTACLLLGAGSPRRHSRIRRAADIGAVLECSRDIELLLLSASVPETGVDDALDLLAAAVSTPSYRAVDVDMAAECLAAGSASGGPHTQLRRALLRHRFGPHPISADPAVSAEILAVTAGDVHELHDAAVVPDGAVLLIVGAVESARVFDAVAELFGHWQGMSSGLRLPTFAAAGLTGGPIWLGSGAGSSALVTTAGPGLAVDDPGQPALWLASLVLGDSGSARLFRRIRKELGLAYFTSSGLEDTAAGAWATVDVTTAPGNGTRVASAVASCMTDLATDGPSQDEVEEAKRRAHSFTATLMSTRAAFAAAVIGSVLRGLSPDWPHVYRERVEAVDANQVAAAAARYLNPAMHSIAVYDPASSR